MFKLLNTSFLLHLTCLICGGGGKREENSNLFHSKIFFPLTVSTVLRDSDENRNICQEQILVSAL